MPTSNIEDYLKQIYKLQTSEEKRATTTSLAERLSISPASVTDMIKKLSEQGFVRHTPYYGVELTEQGRKRALRIIRRHRLWELFLVEVLKYAWDEIDEEAERLEHITSEKLEERLDTLLSYPRIDPHGHSIPTKEGAIDDLDHPALTECEPGVTVAVSHVSDESPELLQYIAKLGIGLQKQLKVKERIVFDGSLRVEIDGKDQFVSQKLAQNIFVQRIKTPKRRRQA